MDRINLPKLLDIPDKLMPIIEKFDDYRYFLLEGGRGGGKSQSIGRFILYLAEMYKLRVVCGRETQNSISESVHSLLSDLIQTEQLDFEVLKTKITSRKNESPISFRGFREQGACNVQGMEGVDIVWIDESQAITKRTLDVLIPTIRKDKAKLFFSMNRYVYNDPVFDFLKDRKDCLHISINFDENPFCTNALKKEAEECKKKNEKDYDHIWRGNPLEQGDDSLYSLAEILYCKENPHRLPGGKLTSGYGIKIGAFDIARYGDDMCAVVVLQQVGALHWEEVYCEEWNKKDLNYTTGRILAISNEQRLDGAIIDEDGIGAGPLDTLTRGRELDYFKGFRNTTLGYKDDKNYGNVRTRNAYKAKDLFMNGHLCIKNEKAIEELTTAIKYTFDHQQRRLLISKEKLRAKGIKSPNIADAIIMAVSLIGEVKEKQEQQYQTDMPTYSPEADILGLAGVR